MNAPRRIRLLALLCLLLPTLSGCHSKAPNGEPRATILIWHDWPDPQSAALEELLRGFEEVYPNITVVVEYVPMEEMQESVLDRAAAGLGPDLIIESDMAIVADLHDADLLVDLKQHRIKTDELLPHAVDALRVNDGLYGVPFAAHTNILYFNKKLIESPPDSLADLRTLWSIDEIRHDSTEIGSEPPTLVNKPVIATPDDPEDEDDSEENQDDKEPADPAEDEDPPADPDEPQAAESIEKAKERVVAQIGSFVGRHDGRQVALATDFFHAYWGIRAFGGHAIGAEGQLTVDEGFTNWLKWLLEIQQDPAIILDNNYDDLVDAFANGRTALMIGDSDEFVELQRRLGVESLGISTLPQGAEEPGGLLELEVISMSKLTAHPKICAQVIRYLCNEINQRKIALSEVGQIPVNRKIRFNPRLMPVAATLKKQIQRTSIISLSNVRFQERMFDIGNSIYLEVLAGELDPDDAIRALELEMKRRAAADERAAESD